MMRYLLSSSFRLIKLIILTFIHMIEREQSEDVKSLMPDEIEKFTNSIF